MQTLDEVHDRLNGALTSTLIRTILESRRALRMAMSMMQELVQAGAAMELVDDSSRAHAALPGGLPGLSLPGAPRLALHQGTGVFALKRRSTSRAPLRLVSPFRHDSPLVMPGDSTFADAEDYPEAPKPEEPKRERRVEEEEEEPSKPADNRAPR